MLFVLQQVGWHPGLVRFARRPIVWAVEVGYWIDARNRQFFSQFLFRGGQQRCGGEKASD